jgi:regulator of RNase E activity RraB
MPTPKMLAMQETITNTLQNNTRLSAERSVLAEALREEGVDPDAVIARKEQEAAAFLETLREAGLDNTGVPYDINPVEESVADDTPDAPLE